jgi:putative transposase
VLGLSVEIVRKPQKPVAEKVAKRWAEEWAKEGKQVDWQRLMLPKGFRVLPRRWVVERTFAWISHNRRMAKDYERLCATGEAFIYVAMSRLMVRRLARCIGVSRQSLEGVFSEVRLDGVLGSPYSAL